MPDHLLPSYLLEITNYLENNEAKLWEWFASTKIKAEHGDGVRLELLKSTYRIDPQSETSLYAAAQGVADKLGIDHPVTLYQAQQIQDLNASLAYIPGEPHIIFYGPLLKTLQMDEVAAVIGHELHHYQLWEMNEQRYFTAHQLLEALANDHQGDASYLESARLFSLYTEIYCDRGALQATDNLDVSIGAMVKMTTGLDSVNAQSYLKQADEVLQKQSSGSLNVTHPESFLRSKALQLWRDHKDENTIAALIRGPVTLQQLDLLEKEHLCGLTRALIQTLLQYPWIQTDAVLAHARQFFHDIDDGALGDKTLADTNQDRLQQAFKEFDKGLLDYFCYVLLDFSAVDRTLDDAPLAACIVLTEKLGMLAHFTDLVKKELKLTKKRFDALSASAGDLLKQLTKDGAADE